jgi:hypothetical protein
MDEFNKAKMTKGWYDEKEFVLPPKQVVGEADLKIIEFITPILKLIEGATKVENIELFGMKHTVDFSQFKPRGHYAKDKHLRGYFAAMMWLGRFSFSIENKPSDLTAPALLLHKLIQETGCYERYVPI